MKTWQNLEERVRATAAHIWNAPCQPGRIAGVNVDAVVDLATDAKIFIEITEQNKLNKVREDIVKLATARMPYLVSGISVRSYIVVEGTLTQGMKDAASDNNVKILNVDDFDKLFFDFPRYSHLRTSQSFGSAINPLSGAVDNTAYVAVNYVVEDTGKDISLKDISKFLKSGRHIVLIGEYGSGKSRCVKELFSLLSASASETQDYPVAVNLRDCWGLKRAGEIVRRHFTDLGLEEIQAGAIKASLAGSVIFLLDGFDELGSQSWANDDHRLKSIRTLSMEAVSDMASKTSSGILISGREHYFSSQSEMIAALGVDKNKTIVVRAKSEFSEEEMASYFLQRGIDPEVPSWLPRRPLICQTVVNLDDQQIQTMFGLDGNEASFWDHFIGVVASRDATINARFDADVILQVMVALSRITRSKPTNVGPISLEDMQRAFEIAVGRTPVEDASVMLQRLPALGRIGSESADRQFIDVAILDTLRAKDVAQLSRLGPEQLGDVSTESWKNPLSDLGQRILSQTPASSRAELDRTFAAVNGRSNTTLTSDLAAGLMRGTGTAFDFHGAVIKDGNFSTLDFSDREITNLTVDESVVHELILPAAPPPNVLLKDSLIGRVRGASSADGLPNWVIGNHVDHYDSAQNVAAIRRIGLSPQHEVLVSILKKTFFQPGAGRQEDALLRGLALITRQNKVKAIINVLLRENILTRFKGKEGWVYAPERSHAGRMKSMLDELSRSRDPIWLEIGEL